MITTSKPRLDPPLFIALTATYLVGVIVAFFFSYFLLSGEFAPIQLPPLPFPGSSPAMATPRPMATDNLPTPPNTVTVPPSATITAASPAATEQLPSPQFTVTATLPSATNPVKTENSPSSQITATKLPGAATMAETENIPSTQKSATATLAAATTTATENNPPSKNTTTATLATATTLATENIPSQQTTTTTATPTRKPTRTAKPKPTSTPIPPAPESAFVSGVTGHPMISLLDCEARAAVDWAGFFGVSIDERDFLNKMPYSDNPEKGYVGHWWEPAGNIPPGSYGIHARPVAELLRSYGLKAQDYKKSSFYDLQMELASGHPVIVWVIGPVQAVKNGVEYTASDGEKTIVAPYEHTVLLIGYDSVSVTILDGAHQYTRTIRDFKTSWAVLGNMVIIDGD